MSVAMSDFTWVIICLGYRHADREISGNKFDYNLYTKNTLTFL